MKLFLVAVVVLAVAAGGADCWVLPFFGGASSNSTTGATSPNATVSPVANATLVAPAPCIPAQTLSPTLQALQERLPPQFGALVTPTNVKALENVGVLAGLATSAATGNPVAIVKLVSFLASKDNPIGPLVDMTKQIVPLLKPEAEEIGQSLSNFTSTASHAIGDKVSGLQEEILNLIHRQPTTLAPVASSVAPSA